MGWSRKKSKQYGKGKKKGGGKTKIAAVALLAVFAGGPLLVGASGCGAEKLFTGGADTETVSQARLAYASASAALATAHDTRAELIAAGVLNEAQSKAMGEALDRAGTTLRQARPLLSTDEVEAEKKIAEARDKINSTQDELGALRAAEGGGQ